jgi:hypothetical protein
MATTGILVIQKEDSRAPAIWWLLCCIHVGSIRSLSGHSDGLTHAHEYALAGYFGTALVTDSSRLRRLVAQCSSCSRAPPTNAAAVVAITSESYAVHLAYWSITSEPSSQPKSFGSQTQHGRDSDLMVTRPVFGGLEQFRERPENSLLPAPFVSWGRLDSNQRPTDYEPAGPSALGSAFRCRLPPTRDHVSVASATN